MASSASVLLLAALCAAAASSLGAASYSSPIDSVHYIVLSVPHSSYEHISQVDTLFVHEKLSPATDLGPRGDFGGFLSFGT
eukprot:1358859-Alexandrium_andersonii.AAC.1